MKIAWLRRIVPPMLLLFVLQASIAASPPTSPPTSPPDPISAATGPTVEQIQAKLAALATLRDLPENERTQAQEFYQQAISHLQAVKNYADTLAYYQQLQQSAPSETARLQQSPPACNNR